MNQGRIVQAGTPEDTYFHPASAFVATLFGPVNRLMARVTRGRVETALGVVPANGRKDGIVAQVMVRPEALVLSSDANAPGVAATVLNARLLGNTIHLRLSAESGLDTRPLPRVGPVDEERSTEALAASTPSFREYAYGQTPVPRWTHRPLLEHALGPHDLS